MRGCEHLPKAIAGTSTPTFTLVNLVTLTCHSPQRFQRTPILIRNKEIERSTGKVWRR